jgi:hypothetical protein
MKFEEKKVLEGIVEQINHKEPFADIAVDVGNADRIYSKINLDVSYEDTLEDLEKTLGRLVTYGYI